MHTPHFPCAETPTTVQGTLWAPAETEAKTTRHSPIPLRFMDLTAPLLLLPEGRQVKALNPRTKVVAYLHSNKVMPWYKIRQTMHNYTDLDYCYNGDGMNETSCRPANTNEVFYDFRKKASLDAWSSACIAMTKTGYVDGCFADGALKVEAPVGKDIRTDFLAKKQSMLRMV